MAGGRAVKIGCMMVVFMVVAAHYAEAVACNQVVASLLPCLNYLRNGGPVTAPCCNGVNAVNNAAKTTVDRRSTCGCLKTAASSYQINAGNAVGLPGKCGVSLPFKFSTDIDCNKIQ